MKSNVVCHNLLGISEETKCVVVGKLIKEIEDIDISLCSSKRYEACFIYIRSLINLAVQSIRSDITPESVK